MNKPFVNSSKSFCKKETNNDKTIYWNKKLPWPIKLYTIEKNTIVLNWHGYHNFRFDVRYVNGMKLYDAIAIVSRFT